MRGLFVTFAVADSSAMRAAYLPAMNSALLQQGVANSAMISTVFDGVARHTPEGHAFVAQSREHGFREAVRQRDEPFGDYGRKASGV